LTVAHAPADAGIERTIAKAQGTGAAARRASRAGLSARDVSDMRAMDVAPPAATKGTRPEHKFQKKPAKHKDNSARVGAKAGVSPYGGFDDGGAALAAYAQVGRKGGVVR
jgi:hypothetical protein